MSAVIRDAQGAGADSVLSDAVLAWRTLEHPDAFAELYQRYRMRVYRYLRARLPSDEDAADVTQQVFLSAFGQVRQYRADRASFATWLLAIARHAAIDFQRRYRSMVEWGDLRLAISEDDDNLVAGLVRQEAIARLRELLAALSPSQRELLALRYGAELTVPEIAALLGKSREATYKPLSRLLQSLEDTYLP